ncbi:hypothetical protein JXA12_03955 [Candidatus Woesearchaeota archaeon]|nr:hypothetical protein [Candidatus Woesearchaeota archaeon]
MLADTGKTLDQFVKDDLGVFLQVYASLGLPRSLLVDDELYSSVMERLEVAGWCRLEPDASCRDALFVKCFEDCRDGARYVHAYIVPNGGRDFYGALRLQHRFESSIRDFYGTGLRHPLG